MNGNNHRRDGDGLIDCIVTIQVLSFIRSKKRIVETDGDSDEHDTEVENKKGESLVMPISACAKSDDLGKTCHGKVGRMSAVRLLEPVER